MATVLYISPDPTREAFGHVLGCGYRPDVPPQFASIATAPCVLLAGAGLPPVVMRDDGTLTPQSVATALAPFLTAEQAAQATAAQQNTNQSTIQQQAQGALANNRTYLAIGTPTNAQIAAQVAALTRQVQALIRLALNQFDATN